MFKKSITALLLIIAILSLSACIKEPIEPKEPIDTTVYTLSYDLDGGTLKITNPGSYNGKTPSFTLNNPTKEYFTFVGWSTSADLSNPVLDVTISPGTKGNTTFYAVWARLKSITKVNVKSDPFSIFLPTVDPYIFYGEIGISTTLEFPIKPEFYGMTFRYSFAPYSDSDRLKVQLTDKLIIKDMSFKTYEEINLYIFEE